MKPPIANDYVYSANKRERLRPSLILGHQRLSSYASDSIFATIPQHQECLTFPLASNINNFNQKLFPSVANTLGLHINSNTSKIISSTIVVTITQLHCQVSRNENLSSVVAAIVYNFVVKHLATRIFPPSRSLSSTTSLSSILRQESFFHCGPYRLQLCCQASHNKNQNKKISSHFPSALTLI